MLRHWRRNFLKKVSSPNPIFKNFETMCNDKAGCRSGIPNRRAVHKILFPDTLHSLCHPS